ncbi:hypothetical protein QS257_19050 [Terrilactibacillus sp. S3-3]|nr:hypothetical protein QS257_19050 [Terrilactibacillus sp. S3-3]
MAHFINLFGPSEGTVLGNSMVFIAHVLVVFALIALYDAQAEKRGFAGFFGMLFSVIGTIGVSGIVFVEIAGASGVLMKPVFQAPVSYAIFIICPLMFVLGMLLLGASIARAKVTSVKGGFLLILGTLVFVSASFSAGEIALVIDCLGAAITGAGFLLSGLSLALLNPRKKPRQSARLTEKNFLIKLNVRTVIITTLPKDGLLHGYKPLLLASV